MQRGHHTRVLNAESCREECLTRAPTDLAPPQVHKRVQAIEQRADEKKRIENVTINLFFRLFTIVFRLGVLGDTQALRVPSTNQRHHIHLCLFPCPRTRRARDCAVCDGT